MSLQLRVIESMRDIDAGAWDALHGDRDSPFVRHAWLSALEETRCVGSGTGWIPRHVTLWRDGLLVAACPAYVKAHSDGEFVFDWQWADVSARLGHAYYPKLVAAVPFTPVTGSRLLRAPGESLAETATALGEALLGLVRRHGLSSAHVLFPHHEEHRALVDAGWLPRTGMQYHWHNEGYTDREDFLARFQSKRRNTLRREWQQPDRDGVRIEVLEGASLDPALVPVMHRFYASTVDRYFYGRRYLNEAFFARVTETCRDALQWVVARDADGVPIAGAINARRGNVLYGRYWGADREMPFLHFNVCYYRGIEQCLAKRLAVFEPGAGGEHKLARGFDPTRTYSAHWVVEPRLRRILESHLAKECAAVDAYVDQEFAASPLRRKDHRAEARPSTPGMATSDESGDADGKAADGGAGQ